ncbi:MAG TPA: phosphotransferase family protein [Acidimicrobiia bacterium]|jgi:aminoglycoside phosphotransferase (APT) family kinase protein|nr:phosphotransferase family protein [Acidimicrobiia bacterium]
MEAVGVENGPEVIPVRPDEDLDRERLASYLVSRLAGAEGPMEVSQFAGGHANLTYQLRFGSTEYVLRRPPLGPVAPTSHDMGREYRVLSTLWSAFPLAPRAYLHCDDLSVIGTEFFIMERRHGVVVRDQVPAVFGGGADPVANRQLSEVVIDTLADFHAVDPAEAGLGDLGHPEGFLERQVGGWIERFRRASTTPIPVADELASWLPARIPDSPAPTLVHNDWRLDNMAVHPDDPARCVAVYDWDMTTRGDPMADLGTLLAVWYRADEIPSALNPMPTTVPGFMDRDAAAHRYAKGSGRDLADLPWYVVFGSFKMAVILQQIHLRWLHGQTRDARFATMGDAADQLFRLAADRRPT